MKAVSYFFVASIISLSFINCGGGSSGGSFGFEVQPVARDVSFPVGIAAAPGGRVFFTEIETGLVRVIVDGALQVDAVAELAVSTSRNEGLTGIAVDPSFEQNGRLYLYYTAENPLRNKLVSIETDGLRAVSGETVLLDNLPVGAHNGGPLEFASDGTLFVSVGDADVIASAQDDMALSGKILRIHSDGSVPADNPFPGSLIYALGFRNSFGLARNPQSGELWASDNGPECDDELNLIRAGGNYGWRREQDCGDRNDAFIQPAVRFEASISPTGMVFYEGAEFPELVGELLMGDFINGNLYRFSVNETGAGSAQILENLVTGGLGGLLDIAVASDGVIYFTTRNGVFRIVRSVN